MGLIVLVGGVVCWIYVGEGENRLMVRDWYIAELGLPPWHSDCWGFGHDTLGSIAWRCMWAYDLGYLLLWPVIRPLDEMALRWLAARHSWHRRLTRV